MRNWNSENIDKFKKFEDIVSRGFYVNGTELTSLYNSVMGMNLNPTSCQTCLKSRFNTLQQEFRAFEAQIKEEEEKSKEKELEEKETAIPEQIEAPTQTKRGRKKK